MQPQLSKGSVMLLAYKMLHRHLLVHKYSIDIDASVLGEIQ